MATPPIDDDAGLPDHYTHDGSGNHPQHPRRGSAGSPRIRAHPALHSYIDLDDGDDAPLWHHPRLDLPSARRILVELFQKVTPRRNERASQLLMSFGHFVTRDITRTEETMDGSMPMPIECDMVETRGPFCPAGQRMMEFYRAARSLPESGGGDESQISSTGEPINSATAWLDMDHVYGNAPPSSPDYMKFRTGIGGKMKLDEATGLPPIDAQTGLYLVADSAMGKLITDFAMLSTFLRYHNQRAEYHQTQDPELDDEDLFHRARMDCTSVYQAAHETKYIPAVLGDPLEPYSGYDPNVDASIDVFFSTCSFRYGHSGMSGQSRLLDENWEPTPRDPILMRDVWENTESIVRQLADSSGGSDEEERHSAAIASIMRGLAHDVTKAPDAHFVDDMSLFTAGSVVKNVQRGRDNGLPSYNDARGWFGMERAESYLDVANGDEAVANMLEGLYGENGVDDVDAYVGAMLEEPITKHDELGPLNEASMREQFQRLRDGDRLYYRARLTDEEIEDLPTLSEVIRDMWGVSDFPEDLFAIVPSGGDQGGAGAALLGDGGFMDLFDGDLSVRWRKQKNHIDFTMSALEKVSGGYIGLGWGSTAMKGAEIWFCESKKESGLFQEACDLPGDDPSKEPPEDTGPFTCCVAPGKRHVRPVCGDKNYLTVRDSCVSDEGSYVTVRAALCPDGEVGDNCFSHTGDLDFIAAYNPIDANAAHGFSRRTGGATNLALGTAASCSDDSAQAGLFALHGATLLIAWLILAPIAIYVVRYYKHKSWRLRVHITIVGVIGGLMLTLVTAALVSVEGTSFGTVDATSATFSKHKIVGLSIMVFVIFMITTGELRRKRTLTKKTKSVQLERAVIISHRCGGLLLTGFAWYNCYTGLVQIGPYEADSVEVTFLSSKTVSMGYDLELFGFIRKYLFWPWLAIVVLTFAVTEFRVRREGIAAKKHATTKGSAILTMNDDSSLQEMTIENFLFLTKHGHALSLIDGYVIDIGTFMEVHPGGTNVLRYAVGSDITSYFTGELDIGGQRHKHSANALRALRPLVKWKLEREKVTVKRRESLAFTKRARATVFRPRTSIIKQSSHLLGHVFRNGRIVEHEVLALRIFNAPQNLRPAARISSSVEKIIIRLCVSVKRDQNLDAIIGTPLPTSTFIFRAVDENGQAFERPYNPSRCYLSIPEAKSKSTKTVLPLFRQGSKSGEAMVYEFFISLVPGGKMSGFLATKRPGRTLMVKGPLASKHYLENLNKKPWKDVCLITQGTGITPGLQLIDHLLKMKNPPTIRLVWLVKSIVEGEGGFEDRTGLSNREAGSKHFRYLILSDHHTRTSEVLTEEDAAECEPRDAFVQQYRTHQSKGGIHHPKTVASLLSWVYSESQDRARSLMEAKPVTEEQEDQTDNNALVNLKRIGETLRTGLALTDNMRDSSDREDQCFSGSDAVTFLVEEGYTPTRDSALALGRELASKLDLFEHVSDSQTLLLDEADQLYIFHTNTGREPAFDQKRGGEPLSSALDGQSLASKLAKVGTQRLVTDGFLVALCGHNSFENDLADALYQAGLVEEQVFRFPEGSVPVSKLSDFFPGSEVESSDRSGGSDVASNLDTAREAPVPEPSTFDPNESVATFERSVRFDSSTKSIQPESDVGPPSDVVEETGSAKRLSLAHTESSGEMSASYDDCDPAVIRSSVTEAAASPTAGGNGNILDSPPYSAFMKVLQEPDATDELDADPAISSPASTELE